jgi:hypothetical protein
MSAVLQLALQCCAVLCPALSWSVGGQLLTQLNAPDSEATASNGREPLWVRYVRMFGQ